MANPSAGMCAKVGAGIGFLLGSFVPGIGNIVGGIIGYFLGGIIGTINSK